MVWPTAFAEARARAVRLAERTSLRVGGTPEWLFEPTSAEEAAEAVRLCRRHGVPWRALGGGSNLVVLSGTLAGAVVDTRRLRRVEVEGDRVRAGAGVPFPALVRLALSHGVPALAGCPGIPGTVGGAVAMNAGGRFGCVADALREVEAVDADGRRFTRRVTAADFGYRRSPFGDALVTGATFRRDPQADLVLLRRVYDEARAEKQRSQPLSSWSAGCVFKNPPGTSAGRLIDAAGLKGRREGGAVVSDRHANFIVNDQHASGEDVLRLIEEVRAAVRDRHGVDLELEVRVWR